MFDSNTYTFRNKLSELTTRIEQVSSEISVASEKWLVEDSYNSQWHTINILSIDKIEKIVTKQRIEWLV